MRLAVLFFFWIALVWPLCCAAENADELIEVLSAGQMNWSRGVIVARGSALSQKASQFADNSQHLDDIAQQNAKDNILLSVSEIRIDARRNLAAVLAENNTIAARVAEMVNLAQVIDQRQLAGNGHEVTMQFSLLGGFSQLILPQEIKQVESIKAINNPLAAQKDPGASRTADGYSGLIVDARGIGARPALVPVLVDETGKEVYSPAFVSREYAVQMGVCQYTSSMDRIDQSPRVRPNPLLIKGLRTIGAHQCNIVISNADAFKLRDVSANLHFLKQCRVIIVLDGTH